MLHVFYMMLMILKIKLLNKFKQFISEQMLVTTLHI